MPRYWVVAPFENKDFFEQVWQFDLANGVISIGWNDLGDISAYPDKASLRYAYEEKRYTKNPGSITKTVNMIWNFYHEIEKGDVILARRGTKQLAGIGIFKGKA